MGLTDLNNLYDAMRVSLKGSAWKEEPQRFEIDFLSEIVRLKQEIDSRTYKTSKGTEFKLNERGKIRHIHGTRMRDRVVRHALCDGELSRALRPYLIHNNGASQKGKGITFSREVFERDLHNFWLKYRDNKGYIGFVDFSKYYDNIRHDKIREMVRPKISEEGYWLLDEILHTFEVDVSYMTDEEYAGCMERKFNSVEYYESVPMEGRTGQKFMPKGVDIGDQVSQDVGIYFPTPVDNYVKIVRGQKWYGRYMDDMYIICRNKEELNDIIRGHDGGCGGPWNLYQRTENADCAIAGHVQVSANPLFADGYREGYPPDQSEGRYAGAAEDEGLQGADGRRPDAL